MTPKEEILERGRQAIERSLRMNAIVCIVIGSVFALFAIGCLVGAAGSMLAGRPFAAAAPILGFALFWCLLTALLLRLGIRGLRRLRRDEHLRASGVRGKATVLSYTESSFKVDGATRFALVLRIDIEGRPPWEVSLDEGVMRPNRVHTGATLPVIVDPIEPADLMIDWFAGSDA